jgi:hypothetical protein
VFLVAGLGVIGAATGGVALGTTAGLWSHTGRSILGTGLRYLAVLSAIVVALLGSVWSLAAGALVGAACCLGGLLGAKALLERADFRV